jgi:hypothetical protein
VIVSFASSLGATPAFWPRVCASVTALRPACARLTDLNKVLKAKVRLPLHPAPGAVLVPFVINLPMGLTKMKTPPSTAHCSACRVGTVYVNAGTQLPQLEL